MPYIETVDELAESIADMCGVHGVPNSDDINFNDDHDDKCRCRICFVEDMKERIQQAVENGNLLKEVI